MADKRDGKPAAKTVHKAYENPAFLKSRDARMIRMMCEYLEPLQRFQRTGIRETVVFFGSARAKRPEEVRPRYEAALTERKRTKGSGLTAIRKNVEQLEGEMLLAKYYDEAAELSKLLTSWAKSLKQGNRFVVCSGGGPGIMEAANRGATEMAGGPSVGLTISLPHEEGHNAFITPELLFQFHYFFMRKLWFVYLATALVIFPGGFGTMDELFEVLTLVQTRKIGRPLPIVLYGKKFWSEWLNFDALVKWGTISPEDVNLIKVVDTPAEGFEYLKDALIKHYPNPMSWGAGARIQDRPL